MSCIVADSGPLIALAGRGLLHLPSALFGKACITQTVHAANRQAGKQRPAVTCCYRARERLDAQTGIGVADCSHSDPINPRILRKSPKSMLGRLTP
jgi:hypothetical protein